jgi:hypothetical protein
MIIFCSEVTETEAGNEATNWMTEELWFDSLLWSHFLLHRVQTASLTQRIITALPPVESGQGMKRLMSSN